MKNLLKDLSRVVVGFEIVKVYKADNLCDLRVVIGENSKLFRKVMITGLVRTRLEGANDAYQIGKYYECINNSSNWMDNPFQLIRYVDKVDGIEKLLLACVNEKKKVVREVKDPMGNAYVDIKYYYHRRVDYLRYRDFVKVK